MAKKLYLTFSRAVQSVLNSVHSALMGSLDEMPRKGYCYSSVMLLHMYKTDPTDPDDDDHPEAPARIARIFEVLQETKTLARMVPIKIREAVRAEAMLVHSEQLWNRIEAFQRQPPIFFDLNRKFFSRLSLFVNEQTAMCARFSLGGVIECCRAVAEGKLQNAFAIVRPPGHHAEPETAMGFCFYNNVAVAAAYLKTMYRTRERPIKRVLILDWDVHHGNGTQRAFWTDPDVLYISLHVYQNGEFYPGGPYGSASTTGSAPGEGRCVNIPWPNSGATDADYIYAFQKIVMPIAYEFAPDFVLISAGFDAAEGDPLGGCHVSPAGFAHMTHMLSCLAEGKMVIALEGGYNVDAIANSALACVKVLLGDAPPMLDQLVASPAATSTCHLVAEIQSQYWRSIKPTFPPTAEYGTAAELVPVSETLKAYRTERMWKEHNMYNVPFSDPELREAFNDQLLVTDNLYQSDTETLVVFIHESGDIRAQLRPEEANIRLEGAFLVETASKVIEHVTAQGWALIDFNTNARLTIDSDANDQLRLQRNAVVHIWDHIVQTMPDGIKIVLIGLDSGCNSLVYLLNQRTAACQMRVKAAVQIYNHGTPESLHPAAKAPGLRDWFYELSMAIFPAESLIARDEAMYGKRFGRIVISPERRTVRALAHHWPDIQDFLEGRIGQSIGMAISQ